jgi:cell division septal protein FtsQ
MAAAAKTKRAYRSMTYGSIAYDLSYLGSTAVEERVAPEVLQPAPRELPRERAQERTRVRVREKQAVAPLSVIGFLAVGIFAVVLLLSYVQLMGLSDHVVSMRSELAQLQKDESLLLARYEAAFAPNALEEAVTSTGRMSRPAGDQIVYIDMSGPDSATVYTPEGILDKGLSLLRAVGAQVALAVEYFR